MGEIEVEGFISGEEGEAFVAEIVVWECALFEKGFSEKVWEAGCVKHGEEEVG